VSGEKIRPWQWFWYDKLRLIVLLEAGLAGFLVGFSLESPQTPIGLYSLPFIGGCSGAMAGWLLSGWFGRQGAWGWFFSFLASILCPILGGALVGTFLAPGHGTLLGAVISLLFLFRPVPFAVWAGCYFSMHLHIRFLRSRKPSR
jgi:hypothetical protein